MSCDWADVPEFGAQEAGREYEPRPGAYAVIFDGERRVLVMATPEGTFLPGGGAEPGEIPEETLRREVREEYAHRVDEMRRLGEAVEYAFSRKEQRFFRKQAVFFVATLGPRLSMAPEADHTPLWLPPDEAAARLLHESHAWVVRRVGSGNRS